MLPRSQEGICAVIGGDHQVAKQTGSSPRGNSLLQGHRALTEGACLWHGDCSQHSNMKEKREMRWEGGRPRRRGA